MEGKSCSFCNLREDNEVLYGKFYSLDNIVTHYYCLLLSSNMEQNGSDSDGILGFLAEDISKEIKRGKRLVCSYCKRTGATLGCCVARCKKVFHLPCGRMKGSLHQFFGQFKSYCAEHRPSQKVSIEVMNVREMHSTCAICYENIIPRPDINTLWAPCCSKNAWFHRDCVQRLALSAGYFFKCPLCNNKHIFQKAMLNFGIFIPEQDASWEMVPNAYEELLHRHNRCDAAPCKCPKGRNYDVDGTRWELILCKLCGSQGVHLSCGQLKWSSPEWECTECRAMLRQARDRRDDDNDEESGEISPAYADTGPENNLSESDDLFITRSEVAPIQEIDSRRRRRIPLRQNVIRRESLQSSRMYREEEEDITVIEDSDDDIQILDDLPPPRPTINNEEIVTNDGAKIQVVRVNCSSVEGQRFKIEGDVNVQFMPETLKQAPTISYATYLPLPQSSGPIYSEPSTHSSDLPCVIEGPVSSKRLRVEGPTDDVHYVESINSERVCAISNEMLGSQSPDDTNDLPAVTQHQHPADTTIEQSLAGSRSGCIQHVPFVCRRKTNNASTKLPYRSSSWQPRTSSNATSDVHARIHPRCSYNRLIGRNVQVPANDFVFRLVNPNETQMVLYNRVLNFSNATPPPSLINVIPLRSPSKARKLVPSRSARRSQRGSTIYYKSSQVDRFSSDPQAMSNVADTCVAMPNQTCASRIKIVPQKKSTDNICRFKTRRRKRNYDGIRKRHYKKKPLLPKSMLRETKFNSHTLNDGEYISVEIPELEIAQNTLEAHCSSSSSEGNKENKEMENSPNCIKSDDKSLRPLSSLSDCKRANQEIERNQSSSNWDLNLSAVLENSLSEPESQGSHLSEVTCRLIQTRSIGAPPAKGTRSQSKSRLHTPDDLETIEKRRRNQFSKASINCNQSRNGSFEQYHKQVYGSQIYYNDCVKGTKSGNKSGLPPSDDIASIEKMQPNKRNPLAKSSLHFNQSRNENYEQYHSQIDDSQISHNKDCVKDTRSQNKSRLHTPDDLETIEKRQTNERNPLTKSSLNFTQGRNESYEQYRNQIDDCQISHNKDWVKGAKSQNKSRLHTPDDLETIGKRQTIERNQLTKSSLNFNQSRNENYEEYHEHSQIIDSKISRNKDCVIMRDSADELSRCNYFDDNYKLIDVPHNISKVCTSEFLKLYQTSQFQALFCKFNVSSNKHHKYNVHSMLDIGYGDSKIIDSVNNSGNNIISVNKSHNENITNCSLNSACKDLQKCICTSHTISQCNENYTECNSCTACGDNTKNSLLQESHSNSERTPSKWHTRNHNNSVGRTLCTASKDQDRNECYKRDQSRENAIDFSIHVASSQDQSSNGGIVARDPSNVVKTLSKSQIRNQYHESSCGYALHIADDNHQNLVSQINRYSDRESSNEYNQNQYNENVIDLNMPVASDQNQRLNSDGFVNFILKGNLRNSIKSSCKCHSRNHNSSVNYILQPSSENTNQNLNSKRNQYSDVESTNRCSNRKQYYNDDINLHSDKDLNSEQSLCRDVKSPNKCCNIDQDRETDIGNSDTLSLILEKNACNKMKSSSNLCKRDDKNMIDSSLDTASCDNQYLNSGEKLYNCLRTINECSEVTQCQETAFDYNLYSSSDKNRSLNLVNNQSNAVIPLKRCHNIHQNTETGMDYSSIILSGDRVCNSDSRNIVVLASTQHCCKYSYHKSDIDYFLHVKFNNDQAFDLKNNQDSGTEGNDLIPLETSAESNISDTGIYLKTKDNNKTSDLFAAHEFTTPVTNSERANSYESSIEPPVDDISLEQSVIVEYASPTNTVISKCPSIREVAKMNVVSAHEFTTLLTNSERANSYESSIEPPVDDISLAQSMIVEYASPTNTVISKCSSTREVAKMNVVSAHEFTTPVTNSERVNSCESSTEPPGSICLAQSMNIEYVPPTNTVISKCSSIRKVVKMNAISAHEFTALLANNEQANSCESSTEPPGGVCLAQSMNVHFVPPTNALISNCSSVTERTRIKAAALTARKFRPASSLEIQQRNMLRKIQKFSNKYLYPG